jgi:hypothetical protein
MEFQILSPEEASKLEWVSLPDDDADHDHDWQPVWSTNFAGRAYQCQICWDRTD